MNDPSRFCEAFETWANVAQTPLASDSADTKHRREAFAFHWENVHKAIRKSCLLHRLIYGGEALRTRPCPVHQGSWGGVTDPPCLHCGVGPTCECNTGWLPEERP